MHKRRRGRPPGKHNCTPDVLDSLWAYERMCELIEAGKARWTAARIIVDDEGLPLHTTTRRAAIQRLVLFWEDREAHYANKEWDPVAQRYRDKE